VIQVIAKGHGETIQVRGAEAARHFKLSTQVPTTPVYYTSGPTREIRIGNLKVKLVHTRSGRKVKHAGEEPGLALSALWYLGENNINTEVRQSLLAWLCSEKIQIIAEGEQTIAVLPSDLH
jgi:hypothetical protein